MTYLHQLDIKCSVLLKMTYLQQSDSKVHRNIYTGMEDMLDEADDIPMDEVRKKIFSYSEHKRNRLSSKRSRPILPVRRCLVAVAAPSIVSQLTARGVMGPRLLFTLRNQGLP